MKKSTELLINSAMVVAGSAIAVLSSNENFLRRLEVVKKACNDVNRQISNNKILEKQSASILYIHRARLLSGYYDNIECNQMAYGEFFLLHCAADLVYGDCKDNITVGRYFSDDREHFRSYEKAIIHGKLFIFIAKDEDVRIYDETNISYPRICNAGKNINGTVYVFDIAQLEKDGYDPQDFGESLVSIWKQSVKERKDKSAEENTTEEETA